MSTLPLARVASRSTASTRRSKASPINGASGEKPKGSVVSVVMTFRRRALVSQDVEFERIQVRGFVPEFAKHVGVIEIGDMDVDHNAVARSAVGKGPAFCSVGRADCLADELDGRECRFNGHGGAFQAARGSESLAAFMPSLTAISWARP